MPFGQIIVGPPGSGKTTYCNAASQLLAALGRKVAIVNLDPANDIPPYTPDVDVAELVCLESVMRELQLGPNGGARRLSHSAGWCCAQLPHRGAARTERRKNIAG